MRSNDSGAFWRHVDPTTVMGTCSIMARTRLSRPLLELQCADANEMEPSESGMRWSAGTGSGNTSAQHRICTWMQTAGERVTRAFSRDVRHRAWRRRLQRAHLSQAGVGRLSRRPLRQPHVRHDGGHVAVAVEADRAVRQLGLVPSEMLVGTLREIERLRRPQTCPGRGRDGNGASMQVVVAMTPRWIASCQKRPRGVVSCADLRAACRASGAYATCASDRG